MRKKNYMVVKVREDQYDLVNILDNEDRYMIAEDQDFKEGDVVDEDSFELGECMYVDEQGYGKATFAFSLESKKNLEAYLKAQLN